MLSFWDNLRQLFWGTPSGQTTDAELGRQMGIGQDLSGADELAQFLQGYMIFPETKDVFSIRFLPGTDELEITDQQLNVRRVPASASQAADFFNTADKDVWIKSHLPVDFGRPQDAKDARDYGDQALLEAFLDGKVILHFQSSFGPVAAKYDRRRQLLGTVHRDGFVATFSGVPLDFAEALARAESKGAFWHRMMKLGKDANGKWLHRYEVHRNVWLDQFESK